MRWTGSALRLFEVVAVVLLAVSVTAPAGTAVGPAARVQADAGDREYQVQPGDSLWGVAGSELGDPYRWPEIAAASASIVQPGGLRLVDPDLIRPGWSLALPAGSSLRDQPAVKAPEPVGVSLSELEAMTFDPLEETRTAGIQVRTEAGFEMTPERGFVNGSFGILGWLRALDGRESVRREIPGFEVGHRQFAWAENMVDDSDGDPERFEYRQFLSVGVLAFDSQAHAREYVDWLPTFALDRADKPARAALVAAGKGAVLWRSGSEGHFLDVALIPRGKLVGEVVTRGFKEDGHRRAIKPLALALADRMADIETRARPYDAARVVAAPLPGDAWAALGDSRSTYPEVIPCDHPEVECYPDMVDGLWERPPVESAHGYFIDARALDDDVEYPLVGTELIAYASKSEAADAMGNVVGRWLAREGGEEFARPRRTRGGRCSDNDAQRLGRA